MKEQKIEAERNIHRKLKGAPEVFKMRDQLLPKINTNLCIDAVQPHFSVITMKGGQFIRAGYEILFPPVIKYFLDYTPESTYKYLGMKNPSEEFFHRYIIVPPSSVRLAEDDDGQLVHDNLTLHYNKLVQLTR